MSPCQRTTAFLLKARWNFIYSFLLIHQGTQCFCIFPSWNSNELRGGCRELRRVVIALISWFSQAFWISSQKCWIPWEFFFHFCGTSTPFEFLPTVYRVTVSPYPFLTLSTSSAEPLCFLDCSIPAAGQKRPIQVTATTSQSGSSLSAPACQLHSGFTQKKNGNWEREFTASRTPPKGKRLCHQRS